MVSTIKDKPSVLLSVVYQYNYLVYFKIENHNFRVLLTAVKDLLSYPRNLRSLWKITFASFQL